MRKLKELITALDTIEVIGNDQKIIEHITFDSRSIENYTLFVAIKGTQVDGHQYITSAEKAGAEVIVCEKKPIVLDKNSTYILVKDSSIALGILAATFYDNPSKKIKLIGVTGTNGKTTVVTLLHNLYLKLGYKAGLISTVKNMVNQDVFEATHTTPNPIELNYLLSKMVEKGCEFCFMEVSSHAIVQNRITGLHFTGGAFTNITHDHLDFHGNFKNYIDAKKGFFDALPKDAFALTNNDDKNGSIMLQNTEAKKRTYGIKSMADFSCKIIENNFTGLLLDIDNSMTFFSLAGNFNAYNLLCVYGIATLLGNEKEEILKAMSQIKGPDGRFDCVIAPNGVVGIIDYAHTPDALENVLKTINAVKGNGDIITVVGCGGNRDKSKRNKMALIAIQMSKTTILTSDNPRFEEPDAIINDMQENFGHYERIKSFVIVDRKEAIRAATHLAAKNDIILIAGKGHEKYQEIKGIKHPFDDKQILKEFFNLLT